MKNKKLYKTVLTALFTALSFAGVYVQIKLPVGMIHLGNFVCIMSSFILGGLLGGVSGAIGMMLADITLGYGMPSAVRTLILKFFMGLIAGSLFKYYTKKDKDSSLGNLIITILLGIVSITTTVLSFLSYQGKFVISYTKASNVVTKTLEFHWLIPVVFAILFLFSLIVLILRNRVEKEARIALISSSFAIAFNVFGEIFIKSLLYYWLNSSYNTLDAAFMYSVSGIPSTLATSCITLALVSFIFTPVYKAYKQTNAYNILECDNKTIIE